MYGPVAPGRRTAVVKLLTRAERNAGNGANEEGRSIRASTLHAGADPDRVRTGPTKARTGAAEARMARAARVLVGPCASVSGVIPAPFDGADARSPSAIWREGVETARQLDPKTEDP